MSGVSLGGQSENHSEPQLMEGEGLGAEPTHPGRSFLLLGWSRASRRGGKPVALRCGKSLIPGQLATHL